MLRCARNDTFCHCEAGGRGSLGLLRFARNDGGGHSRSQLCQNLKRAPRLAAQLGFEGTKVSALPQLPPMLVHHFEVHEKVGAEHLQLKVGALHIQTGFITHFFQQHIGQAARAKHLGGRQRIGQSFSALGQRHKAAAGSLRQALQERLNFVFQHARHQPFGAVVTHLVEHKQGHGHRDAVFGVARVMQIRGLAVGAAQADHLGKRLGGDAHRLVAHQTLPSHQEWLGLIACRTSAPQFLAVPTLQRFAAAHVLG